ncbi:acyltransferase family protein [Luteolibacter sp. Populi]|uniref:acyltransferase family protein n=1 Tax=Luteolibacter sp. Populi TaxID=3230487 RepID=UPI00346648CD
MFSAKTVQLLGPATTRQAKVPLAVPEVAATARKSERFFHLDALRAGLMFWGILVHTSTLAPPAADHPSTASVVFRKFAEASGLVRMEAFFIISGFLAYMLLQKYGARTTVKKRLVAIGVPFVTALVLLNPLTNWLVFIYHNHAVSFSDYLAGKGTAHAEGPGNWHLHLWFLLALFAYSLLAPLLGAAVDAVMRHSADREPRPWTLGKLAPLVPGLKFLAMCLMVCAGCVGARVAFEVAKHFLHPESQFVIRSIGNYLPYYALGMILFASTELRGIFSKVHWIQALGSGLLLWAVHQSAGDDPDRLHEVLILAAQTYVALCLSSLLFWLARKLVKAESAMVRFLSEAAYSVYLFHYLAIYCFALLLRHIIPMTGLMMTMVAIGTFIATLCLHAFIIQPVPVLAFLLNGKPPKRAK